MTNNFNIPSDVSGAANVSSFNCPAWRCHVPRARLNCLVLRVQYSVLYTGALEGATNSRLVLGPEE